MANKLYEETNIQAIANAIRAKGQTGTMTVAQMPSKIAAIQTESPETSASYVKTEALGVANTLVTTAGDFKILFCTDLHWQGNDSVPHAAQAIKAITRMSDIDLVVFGGDYIANWTEVSKATALSNIKSCRDVMAGIPCKTLWLRGNHDTNGYPNKRLTRQECFEAVASTNAENGAVINSSDPYGNYGYIDFTEKKIRVIFANTSDNDDMAATAPESASAAAPIINCHNLTAAQLQWMANNALNFAEDGWKVIFVSHLPFFFSTGSGAEWYNSHTYVDGNGKTWTCSLKNMSDLLIAYISKTNFSVTHNGTTVSKNFSSLAHYADIMGGINGHGHAFWVNKDTKVKYIMVGNSCNGGEKASEDGTTYTKTAGTANDTTFDILSFDTTNKTAQTVNYGRGYDRLINLKAGYTNLLPVIGYNDGKRLSTSSGELRDASGRVSTGFIDVTGGDVIRIKGLTFPSSSEGTRAICEYQTSGTFVAGNYLYTGLTYWPPFTFSFSGDMVTITVSSSVSSAKIKVCGDAATGANLIITRNEEITS